MSDSIELLETVALKTDLPEYGLSAGEVGAVVELLKPGVYEVEFVDESGQTYGMHALRGDQLVVLHTRGQPFRIRQVAA